MFTSFFVKFLVKGQPQAKVTLFWFSSNLSIIPLLVFIITWVVRLGGVSLTSGAGRMLPTPLGGASSSGALGPLRGGRGGSPNAALLLPPSALEAAEEAIFKVVEAALVNGIP